MLSGQSHLFLVIFYSFLTSPYLLRCFSKLQRDLLHFLEALHAITLIMSSEYKDISPGADYMCTTKNSHLSDTHVVHIQAYLDLSKDSLFRSEEHTSELQSRF